ncbi:MAG: hypothetical protein KF862_07525 [Chitinophagaceae bacterium]|nr:hypothetical protein [Chitinophagaceae bacterium]
MEYRAEKAKIGGHIVTSWLTVMALMLLTGFNYAEVAVRDIVMAVSAFTIGPTCCFLQKNFPGILFTIIFRSKPAYSVSETFTISTTSLHEKDNIDRHLLSGYNGNRPE